MLHGNKFVQEYSRFSEVIVPHVSLLQNSKCPEVKSDLIFETSTPNTSKYQISDKKVKGFWSYEHLKFWPMCHIKLLPYFLIVQ